jgi:hypothetical protein
MCCLCCGGPVVLLREGCFLLFLAIKQADSSQRIVLVECETKPNRKRVLAKTVQIRMNLSIQKQLFENTMVLPLLVIPPNNLQKILFSTIRKFWEIWIINQEGQIKHKIPRTAA